MTVSGHKLKEQDLLRSRVVLKAPATEVVSDAADELENISGARVCFVINSLEGGGAERVLAALINRVQSHLLTGDIDVVLLDDRKHRYEIQAKVRIHQLMSDGSFLDSGLRFKAYLAARKPSVVVSFLTRANYLAVAFARQFEYRCIISERSDTEGRLGGGVNGWLKKMLVRTLYPRAHHVIAVSEGIRCSLVADFRLERHAISVIPNPCDIDMLQRLSQQPSELLNDVRLQDGFVVAVGRLVKTKRFDVLLRAYAWGGFDAPLVILGEGPCLQSLQALAKELGIADRVIFAGFLANPYTVMARASLYVLCSELEGFPNGLLEAMGLGLPVVATNCNHGPAEILDETLVTTVIGVHQGKHGLLVPTGDAGAMAAAMQQVLGSTALRAFLASRARRRAADFSVTGTVTRYAAVINNELMHFATKRRLA